MTNDTSRGLRGQGRTLLAACLLIALSACGGGGGGSSGTATVAGGAGGGGSTTTVNSVAVIVDSGPAAAGGNNVNTLFTTVTLCAPGSTTKCQTIDHVQIDTGSYGFRVLAGALGQGLNSSDLTQVSDTNGNALVECTQFADGWSWGPVKQADLTIGGEKASGLSVQVIGDSAYPSSTIPSACSSVPGGVEEDTVSKFGANGILGIGVFLQDCGPGCAEAGSQTGSNYNSCTTTAPVTCTPVAVPTAQQVNNPVQYFATDKNGIAITLPSVSASGATTLTGTLYFGIGTQSNNALGSAAVYTVDPDHGYVYTTYKGVSLDQSYVDSGSNAWYFPDNSIATCTGATYFFCPPSNLAETATLQGLNGRQATVSFTVGDASSIPLSVTASPILAGPAGTQDTQTFDWGLPFFFGRTVFVGFEQNTIGGVTGPAIAF